MHVRGGGADVGVEASVAAALPATIAHAVLRREGCSVVSLLQRSTRPLESDGIAGVLGGSAGEAAVAVVFPPVTTAPPKKPAWS